MRPCVHMSLFRILPLNLLHKTSRAQSIQPTNPKVHNCTFVDIIGIFKSLKVVLGLPDPRENPPFSDRGNSHSVSWSKQFIECPALTAQVVPSFFSNAKLECCPIKMSHR